MELVSRDTVLSIAMQYLPDDDGTCSKAGSDLREMLDEIEDINPLDAITVNHGHWDVNVYEMTCSVCGNCFGFEYPANQYAKAYHFCPHCGAKMDGGDDDVGQNANDR